MLRLRHMSPRGGDYDRCRTMASERSGRLFPVLLSGALVIGTLDAAYAVAFWAIRSGTNPSTIFQSIAAGLLGRKAFAGGVNTVLLGALLHYCIAFVIVAVYWACSRRMAVLVRRPYAFGALYGLAVYLVMNYAVVPLSAARQPPFVLAWVVCSVVVHAVFVGVPAALFSRMAAKTSAS
jgi:hypothetical protein